MNKLDWTDGSYFRQFVGGYNFITPNVLGYYRIKDGEAELSCGSGILQAKKTIYGVTVVRGGKHDHDASKMFQSMKEAKEYIKELSETKE